MLGAFALTLLFRETVLSDLDDRLAGVAESLIASVEVSEDGALATPRQPLDPRYGQVFSGRYWQITPLGDASPGDGELRSRSLWDDRLVPSAELVDAALAEPGRAATGAATGPDGEPLRIVVRAVSLPGLETPALFIAAEDRRPADRRVARFALTAAGLFAAFAAALVIGVFVQVRVGLAPVLRMGREVAQVRDGAAERISGAYPAELIPLGGELNALLDHSREVVGRARTHVGNLAHALKTPITVLSNEARGEEGPLADLVRRQTAVMSDQVEHHLRRARAAANATAIGARTPVGPVIDDLGRTLRRIHDRRGIAIDWSSPGELAFRGERQDLEDLVGNLVDNACKWAAVQVRVEARPIEGSRFEIRVEDDGPGLSEAEREQALARGVRLDEQTPGAGLGLAIVDDLARAYGGALNLERSELGGLLARLELPRARATTEETPG
ncbi:ATP-binding protein [Marinicauda salina]|uniref:histidine kinase n=2 Tax=Marinicauda salina TaxID=2135793 RepID=A0A2U2BT26_9PROT|nr:ATP-binding protein [Marinicauda salina]